MAIQCGKARFSLFAFRSSHGVTSFRRKLSLRPLADLWRKAKSEKPRANSELLDGGLMLQQDRDVIANGIDALALIALQTVFAAHHQRLAANRTGKNFQQVGRDHEVIVAEKRRQIPAR